MATRVSRCARAYRRPTSSARAEPRAGGSIARASNKGKTQKQMDWSAPGAIEGAVAALVAAGYAAWTVERAVCRGVAPKRRAFASGARPPQTFPFGPFQPSQRANPTGFSVYRGGVKAKKSKSYSCPHVGSDLYDWNKVDADGKPVTKTCSHKGFSSPSQLVSHIACHLVRTGRVGSS